MKLALSKDMQKIDEMAVNAHGLTIEKLMEAAGEAVAQAVEEQWGPLSKKTIGVLCGKGHNGGDGLVAARFLKEKKASVVAVIVGEPENLAEETLKQFLKTKAAKIPGLTRRDLDPFKWPWMNAIYWWMPSSERVLPALPRGCTGSSFIWPKVWENLSRRWTYPRACQRTRARRWEKR